MLNENSFQAVFLFSNIIIIKAVEISLVFVTLGKKTVKRPNDETWLVNRFSRTIWCGKGTVRREILRKLRKTNFNILYPWRHVRNVRWSGRCGLARTREFEELIHKARCWSMQYVGSYYTGIPTYVNETDKVSFWDVGALQVKKKVQVLSLFCTSGFGRITRPFWLVLGDRTVQMSLLSGLRAKEEIASCVSMTMLS